MTKRVSPEAWIQTNIYSGPFFRVKSVCIEVDLEDSDCERPCKKPDGKRGKHDKPPRKRKDDKGCGC